MGGEIEIFNAAEEPSCVAEDINKGIHKINKMADDTSNEAQHISLSSKGLTQISSTLTELIGQFKT